MHLFIYVMKDNGKVSKVLGAAYKDWQTRPYANISIELEKRQNEPLLKAGFLTVVNVTGATEDNIYDELYSWFNNLGIIMDVDGDIVTLDVETNVYTNDEDTLSSFISITPDPYPGR